MMIGIVTVALTIVIGNNSNGLYTGEIIKKL